MKQVFNGQKVCLTHTHTHTAGLVKRAMLYGLVMVTLTISSSHAQFINPLTPDIPISTCQSTGVQNSGTTILGDWQVTVVDGDQPSIIFYNHATGQEDCHLLQGVNLGYTISDPDVVWNYSSNQDIYVVYKLTGGSSGFNGIWAERWKMDISASFIFSDVAFTDILFSLPVMAQLYPGNQAMYPNIDYHLTNDEVVVVWEDLGDIFAVADINLFPAFSPLYYHVNSFCTGYTLAGTQADVALGWDNKTVSFTYKQLNGGANEIVVRQDAYLQIALGNATSTCSNETMVPPVAHDDVNFPRISAPKSQFGFISSWDCNVAYEIMSSVGENFIGSSTYKIKNFVQTAPPCPPTAFYTTVNNWSHDIVNSVGVSWSNMNADLRFETNERPVSVYAGDLIYNSWAWDDIFGTRIGLKEILSVITNPTNEILTGVTTNPTPCFPTSFFDVVAYAALSDYLVTGEVWNQSTNQAIVSSASDGPNLGFAFYQPANSTIIIKKAATPGSPFIRKANSNIVNEVKNEVAWDVKLYPNPSSGEVNLLSSHKINHIRIFDAIGRIVQEFQPENNLELLKLEIANPGLYQIMVLSETAEINVLKVLIR